MYTYMNVNKIPFDIVGGTKKLLEIIFYNWSMKLLPVISEFH